MSSMKLPLCEKLQDQNFLTSQDLFHRVQCIEFGNVALDARKC